MFEGIDSLLIQLGSHFRSHKILFMLLCHKNLERIIVEN